MKYKLALILIGCVVASIGVVLHSADRTDAIYGLITVWGMSLAIAGGLWWLISDQEG